MHLEGCSCVVVGWLTPGGGDFLLLRHRALLPRPLKPLRGVKAAEGINSLLPICSFRQQQKTLAKHYDCNCQAWRVETMRKLNWEHFKTRQSLKWQPIKQEWVPLPLWPQWWFDKQIFFFFLMSDGDLTCKEWNGKTLIRAELCASHSLSAMGGIQQGFRRMRRKEDSCLLVQVSCPLGHLNFLSFSSPLPFRLSLHVFPIVPCKLPQAIYEMLVDVRTGI